MVYIDYMYMYLVSTRYHTYHYEFTHACWLSLYHAVCHNSMLASLFLTKSNCQRYYRHDQNYRNRDTITNFPAVYFMNINYTGLQQNLINQLLLFIKFNFGVFIGCVCVRVCESNMATSCSLS